MKKLIFIFTLLVAINVQSQTASDVFAGKEIVFYGLDFSNSKFIGDFGTGDGHIMKAKMFGQWNDLIAKEQPKYNIRAAFRTEAVYYDLNPVYAQNRETEENKILTLNSGHTIDAAGIQAMVKKYQAGDKQNGIGLVFIIETFDKTRELATMHVTFFDIATKKVLFSEKKTGVPQGVGLRNYWAKSVFMVLKDIETFEYNNWKTKYGGKK